MKHIKKGLRNLEILSRIQLCSCSCWAINAM